MSQFQPPYPPTPDMYQLPQPSLPPAPPRKRLRRSDKIALAIIAAIVVIVGSLVLYGISVAYTPDTSALSQADLDSTATASDGLTQTAITNQNATEIAASNLALSNDLTQAALTPTAPPPTVTPPGISTWHTTHTFTGNGDKQTEIFTVPDDWKILYTCTYQDGGAVDGALGVEVYGADGTIQDVAIDATCHTFKSTGDTEEHQAGQVYLKILATGDWTVQVQEFQ